MNLSKNKRNNMSKKISVLFIMFFLVSCKPKAVVAESHASDAMSSKSIIENHYKINPDFKTLYIKSAADYDDGKQSYNMTAEIRIKKDEKILVSIRFLGITMAKALITPTTVKYYEKMGGKFFEGDYELLSNWLGTELDFQKVQNLFIGQPIDDLNKGNYQSQIFENLYRLTGNDNQVEKAFYFEGERFLLKKQEITQPEKQRMVSINYPSFQEYSSLFLPSSWTILANQSTGRTTIKADYNSVAINEEMNFPYSVPDGYERIEIK